MDRRMSIRKRSGSLPTSPKTLRRRWLHNFFVFAGLVALVLASCVCLIAGLNPSFLDPHAPSEISSAASAAIGCPDITHHFLVASGVLLAVWFAIGVVASVSQTLPPAMPMLAILLCMITAGAGIVGAILGAHKGCAQANPMGFTLVIGTSCVFVTVCVPLMGILVHYVVRKVSTPDSKASGVLAALRCTSVSHGTRRCAAVLPFGLLAGLALVLVLVYGHHDESCRQPFVLYLIVSSGLFGVILGVALWCYLHPRSTTPYLPWLLLGHGVVTVAWAVVGTVWIRSNAGLAAPVQCSSGLVSAVHSLRMVLFVLGILLTTFTCCCKLERLCLPLVVPDVARRGPTTNAELNVQVV